jgi:murein DD-endopeptidase MepM/ murein hydrolase activator NlpD
MKYLITLFFVLPHLTTPARLTKEMRMEKVMENIQSVKEFQHIADSLQMSVSELYDYPVIFPIKNPTISSSFEWRKHPIYKMRRFHTGIDIPKVKGTPVYATGNGVVIRKGYDSGYGNFVEIHHSGGFRSFYAHLSRILVNVGDWVNITQQIACIGNTGVATGSHLHYEVRKGKYFLNPKEWCYCLLEILKREAVRSF